MALFPEHSPNGGATFPELNNYSRTGALTDFNASTMRVLTGPAFAQRHLLTRFNYFNRTRSIPRLLGAGRWNLHVGMGNHGDPQRRKCRPWMDARPESAHGLTTFAFGWLARLLLRSATALSL